MGTLIVFVLLYIITWLLANTWCQWKIRVKRESIERFLKEYNFKMEVRGDEIKRYYIAASESRGVSSHMYARAITFYWNMKRAARSNDPEDRINTFVAKLMKRAERRTKRELKRKAL